MPLWWLLMAAGLVVVLAVIGRRSVAAAARETGAALARDARRAGALHIVALLVLVGVGVWLRLEFYDVPMRWDESYTFVTYASRHLDDILRSYDPNNHVLNTLLMHVSYVLFGDGWRVLRAPVFFSGVLLVPAAYFASARLWGRQAALIVAALVAASAQLVEYATNARGYEIETLLAVLLLLLAPQLLRSTNPTYWGLFSVAAALGFYTVPVFAYPFGAIVLALLTAALVGQSSLPLRRFVPALAASVVASVAFAALLYGPIAGDVLRLVDPNRSLGGAPGGGGRASGAYSADALSVWREVWHLWMLAIPGYAQDVLLVGFTFSIAGVAFWRRGPFPLAFSLAALGGLLLVADRVVTFTRVWLALLPLFLAVAIGGLIGWPPIRRILERRAFDLPVAAAAVAIAVSLAVKVRDERLANVGYSPLPSADLIAGYVVPRLQPGDVLVVDSTAAPVEQYSFFRLGRSVYSVVGTIPPAPTGRVYLVVNELVGESLSTAITAAGGSPDVAVDSKKLVEFPGAAVYELRSAKE